MEKRKDKKGEEQKEGGRKWWGGMVEGWREGVMGGRREGDQVPLLLRGAT